MNKQLLTTQEAADYLGVSRYFLERDRSTGPLIPVVYVGARTPRYRQEDLERFLQSRLRVQSPDNDDEIPWDADEPEGDFAGGGEWEGDDDEPY